MKTRAEVEELKRQWSAHPFGDIADTPGFEEYRAELNEFHDTYDKAREEENNARLTVKAMAFGCPGNLSLARWIEVLLEQTESLGNRVKALETQVHRDEILMAFGREYPVPTDAQTEEWVSRHPAIAADIRAHAEIACEWAELEKNPPEEPDQEMLEQGRRRMHAAIERARRSQGA